MFMVYSLQHTLVGLADCISIVVLVLKIWTTHCYHISSFNLYPKENKIVSFLTSKLNDKNFKTMYSVCWDM